MTPPRKKQRRQGRKEKQRVNIDDWVPTTELGRMVKTKQITEMAQIFENNMIIREPQIVDFLLPDLEDDVVGVGKAKRPFKRTQRMTDSGRRQKFFVMAVVGNRNGNVGLGIGKAYEYGPAITKAINAAKLNMIQVPLSCGSWECGCTAGHSVPFAVTGHSGSIRFKLIPAPKGTGLAANDTAGLILRIAGVKDAWSQSKGRTRSRMNMAKAVFDSLKLIGEMKGALK
jgi:small subunit ribosomal protein S5